MFIIIIIIIIIISIITIIIIIIIISFITIIPTTIIALTQGGQKFAPLSVVASIPPSPC